MADNFNSRLYARGYASSISMRAPCTPPAPQARCEPACANCGLLECLCRPRFFAGQLLTEQDLNRLDAYIRAKNRLHNLQLHGWGVVNGLQVRCDACSSGVIVGAGYAIDPCGEDIVVCKDTPVDICDLIKRCRPADITCEPWSRTNGKSNCDDVEEDWVLAIRYSETHARGVTALRSTPSCACGATGGGCSCGGKCGKCGGNNCGCAKKMTSTAPTNAMPTATTRKPRNMPAECEATAICEGYAFDVYPAPADEKRRNPKSLSGPLIDTLMCCLEPLIEALPKPPGPFGNYAQNPAAWHLWCCRMKEALIAFFSTGPQANCTLLEKLHGYSCPSPDDQNFAAQMQQAVIVLFLLLIQAIFACLCSALLPPAPYGTADDRVPLAIVTVRKKDCKVLRVCNWTHLRKLVITLPTLRYWLSWIPWFGSIQDAIAAFCCGDLRLPWGRKYDSVNADAVHRESMYEAADSPHVKVNPTLDAQRAADNQTMTTLIMNAFARMHAPLDPAAVVGGVFGFGPEANQPLTETEKANIGPFLLLNELLRPLMTSTVPPELVKDRPLHVAETIANGGDEAVSLHRRVAALEKAIAEMGGRRS